MKLVSDDEIQAYTAAGWWGTRSCWDCFVDNASRAPAMLAVADPPDRANFTTGEPRRWTYADLRRAAEAMAASFAAAGLTRGDLVMVQLPNLVELVTVYLAAARIGAVVSPLAVQYRTHELRQMLPRVQPKVFITTTNAAGNDLLALARPVLAEIDSIALVLVVGEAPVGAAERSMEAALARPALSAGDAPLPDANACWTICWTSGTEARPKAVPRTHNQWLAIGAAQVELLGLRDGDCLLNPFPLINMSGIGGMLVPWLLTGGTLVLHQPFTASTFLRQIAEERVAYTIAPPVLLDALVRTPGVLDGVNLGSLRTIGSGSAPLPPEMVRRWQDERGIGIANLFGSNEGTALVSAPGDIADPEERARLFPRFGVPGLGWSRVISEAITTRLVDPATGQLIDEADRPGELVVKGPSVISHYYADADLDTRAFDADGFFHTGDLFAIETGPSGRPDRYRFVGRARDLIIRGGMNVSPEEIEHLLAEHPAVAEVAVVGVPDARAATEDVWAVVVPRPGHVAELGALQRYLEEQDVASYKVPRRLMVVDALPRNPLGKVVRASLREQAARMAPRSGTR